MSRLDKDTPLGGRKVLFVADIFGQTPELIELVQVSALDCTVLSPYPEGTPAFVDEGTAYGAFMEQGGLDPYIKRVKQALGDDPSEVVVGFSAGATASWVALSEASTPVEHALLFYGSRIRECTYLRPHCAATLVFAEQEAQFDPQSLLPHLESEGLAFHLWPGTRHGFMNKRSPGYCPDAYAQGLSMIKSVLEQTKTP